MWNSQLVLLSGAANLAAGKLVMVGNLAKIGVEKIDQLIMLSLTAMLNKQLFLLSAAANLAAGKLIKVEILAETMKKRNGEDITADYA
jgi:TRAP-type mannitol/chloroaromatic compound transport system permease small subunit